MSDHHFYSDKSNFKSAVLDGYLFLSETYKPETEEKLEDKIVILGGGPGARYGRGLCGIIEKLGLAMNTVEIHTWYHLFMLRTKHADEISKERKKREAFDVKISFLGLWDCTGNVGINPIVFPYELINPSVEHIRHAVAKDETCKRSLFVATIGPSFTRPTLTVRWSSLLDGVRVQNSSLVVYLS
ncbi:uncharacterized protein FOMMEDRAFT_159967 [Fomitiporia mediterranea MF3/22]|uniref:uncharacterized protein n=1 Tax=Fomitiporia mediterranea (strain MF3/22) TaxID=694068 RepID=UPI0004408E3A|nr:uncharacterized protein FOMMEDRAFT_159967 [Fomitiporia mediterranea MF3/22]EJD00269.1 hypothetical protein FOMMEDRAFT_159967 [Fomitiporia mediterranea MF3/22]